MKLPFHHRPSIRLHAATKTSSDSSKTRVRLLSDNKDLGKKGKKDFEAVVDHMHGWTDGWIGGRMEGWMNGWIER